MDCDCHRGHREDCEALEPAWDIGDLIARTPCDGCCPNGCEPDGFQATQDRATRRTQGFFGTLGGTPMEFGFGEDDGTGP
jgi:hypothetical protein